jgi:virginiamycin A acetyltransferase
MGLYGLMKELKLMAARVRSSERIARFNKATNNQIESDQVSLKAIAGHHINVLRGTFICENSTVGSYSYVGFNSLISRSAIGRYSSIASNVNIGHGEHPLDLISTNAIFMKESYNLFTRDECVIEHDVWIGVGSIIKRGVRVGIGSVVGANSFVNKDVPPYAIVVGSPARILKFRFDEDKIARILASKWWEQDVEEARKIIKSLE